jgi:hypothetical protein
MTIDELYGLLPEARREEAKAAIAEMSKGYVKIDGPDIAAKVMAENPYLKSILESETSKRVENHDTRFKAEKLPGLVEEEIKKRGPKPKDPEVAALSDKLTAMEKEAAELKAAAIMAQQKARAIAALSARKLPETFAEDYIGQTDEETDAKIKRFTDTIDPYIKSLVNSGVLGRIGNNGAPVAGQIAGAESQLTKLRQEYADAARAGQMDAASRITTEIQRLQAQK